MKRELEPGDGTVWYVLGIIGSALIVLLMLVMLALVLTGDY